MRYRQLSFLFLALLLAACGGQLATDSGVSGTWAGAFTEGGVPLTLVLTQTGTEVTGNLTTSGEPLAVSGTAIANASSGTTLISLTGGNMTNSVQIEASTAGSVMRGTVAVNEMGERGRNTFTASR